jgi:hypothetical protein
MPKFFDLENDCGMQGGFLVRLNLSQISYIKCKPELPGPVEVVMTCGTRFAITDYQHKLLCAKLNLKRRTTKLT